MADGDMARLFHRLTSYDPVRDWTEVPDDPWYVTSFEPNDVARLPLWTKAFPPELPVVALPRDLPAAPTPTLDALAGANPDRRRALDLGQLARLLYLSAGVVRTGERDWGTVPFRAAGSAGARFPLEVYVVAPDGVADLPPGVHAYDGFRHALVRLAPAPAGEPAIVVTGVPWRTGWRYRERGYRHIFWDAGTLLSQQLALASSAGLPARLVTDFPDVDVRDLVGADGVDEFPVAILLLGEGEPGWRPGSRAAGGQVDTNPVQFPLVTATHWAAVSPLWGRAWPGDARLPGPLPPSPPVDDVIYRRGSTRRMAASRGVPREILETCLAAALRGIDLPHFVAVHNVAGLVPGLYRWPDLSAPVRPGELRTELRRVALGQGLAGDAAFVVITAADLAAISGRRYRELQLAAGLVEGRLHLAAYALGYGASGMTFLDSEIPGLLGTELDAMLFTCVGVPEYANKRAGRPGTPAAVRAVEPRVDE